MAGHFCATCGIEMPSPGGLAVHEMRHLSDPPPKPAAPAAEPAAKGSHEVPGKRRARERGGAFHRSASGSDGSAPPDGDGPETSASARRRPRRPSRAMSSGGAPDDMLVAKQAPPAPPVEPAPDQGRDRERGPERRRRALDSTIPLTALLVVASLAGGVATALVR